jgi:hypothetical protein
VFLNLVGVKGVAVSGVAVSGGAVSSAWFCWFIAGLLAEGEPGVMKVTFPETGSNVTLPPRGTVEMTECRKFLLRFLKC